MGGNTLALNLYLLKLIQVQGRKISLKNIRTDMLPEHKKFMCLIG